MLRAERAQPAEAPEDGSISAPVVAVEPCEQLAACGEHRGDTNEPAARVRGVGLQALGTCPEWTGLQSCDIRAGRGGEQSGPRVAMPTLLCGSKVYPLGASTSPFRAGRTVGEEVQEEQQTSRSTCAK